MTSSKIRSGFSLLELVIAVGIIGILIVVILVLLRPDLELAASRNAKRALEVENIAKAAAVHMIRGGTLPGLDGDWRMLGTATTGCSRRCGDLRGGSEGTALRMEGKENENANLANPSFFDFDYNQPFTFSYWMKIEKMPDFTASTLVKLTNNGGYVIGVYHNNGDPSYGAFFPHGADQSKVTVGFSAFSIMGGLNIKWWIRMTDQSVLEPGKYYHIAVTNTPSTYLDGIKIYVDGEEVPSSVLPLTESPPPSLRNSNRLTIGGFPFAGTTLVPPNGLIDELAIYNAALSKEQILSIADGDQNITANLVARWNFDEASGSVAKATDANDDLLPAYNFAIGPNIDWKDDEPLLPGTCLDLSGSLTTLPKIPAGTFATKWKPDAARTFYALRYSGSVIARSCLSELEEDMTVLPLIESGH